MANEPTYDDIAQFNYPEESRHHIILSRCNACGAAVFDKSKHNQAHRHLREVGALSLVSGGVF